MQIVHWMPVMLAVISAAVLILLLRARSWPAVAMASGVVIVWIGIALALFGPQTVVRMSEPSPERPVGTAGLASITEIRRPALPIGVIIASGSALFAFGFLAHALSTSLGRPQGTRWRDDD